MTFHEYPINSYVTLNIDKIKSRKALKIRKIGGSLVQEVKKLYFSSLKTDLIQIFLSIQKSLELYASKLEWFMGSHLDSLFLKESTIKKKCNLP